MLISALIGCALTWLYAPRAPALAIDRAELVVIWRFVRFLMMNNVIFFLLQKLDDLFVGKIAGAAHLGIYAFAYNTANNSLLFLTNTLRQVLLPALVSQLEERERFRELALRAISTITNVSWVICAFAGDNLQPGMFGRIRIDYDQRADALTIPRLALLDDEGEPSVYVVREGKAVRTPIELGYIDGNFVEVRKGLEPGDAVVTAGKVALRDGGLVQVIGPQVAAAVTGASNDSSGERQ